MHDLKRTPRESHAVAVPGRILLDICKPLEGSVIPSDVATAVRDRYFTREHQLGRLCL